jgi:hypothetical protein
MNEPSENMWRDRAEAAERKLAALEELTKTLGVFNGMLAERTRCLELIDELERYDDCGRVGIGIADIARLRERIVSGEYSKKPQSHVPWMVEANDASSVTAEPDPNAGERTDRVVAHLKNEGFTMVETLRVLHVLNLERVTADAGSGSVMTAQKPASVALLHQLAMDGIQRWVEQRPPTGRAGDESVVHGVCPECRQPPGYHKMDCTRRAKP